MIKYLLGLVGEYKNNGNRPLTLPSVPSSADLKNKVKLKIYSYKIEIGTYDKTVRQIGKFDFYEEAP